MRCYSGGAVAAAAARHSRRQCCKLACCNRAGWFSHQGAFDAAPLFKLSFVHASIHLWRCHAPRCGIVCVGELMFGMSHLKPSVEAEAQRQHR